MRYRMNNKTIIVLTKSYCISYHPPPFPPTSTPPPWCAWWGYTFTRQILFPCKFSSIYPWISKKFWRIYGITMHCICHKLRMMKNIYLVKSIYESIDLLCSPPSGPALEVPNTQKVWWVETSKSETSVKLNNICWSYYQ